MQSIIRIFFNQEKLDFLFFMNQIIHAYAVFAKTIIIISVVSVSDAKYVHFWIMHDYQCFQKLIMTAAQLNKACDNDNSSLTMINQKLFVISNLIKLKLLNANEIKISDDAKFLINIWLSNIYVDLYFYIFAQEYATLMNCNVLLEKIKYK